MKKYKPINKMTNEELDSWAIDAGFKAILKREAKYTLKMCGKIPYQFKIRIKEDEIKNRGLTLKLTF